MQFSCPKQRADLGALWLWMGKVRVGVKVRVRVRVRVKVRDRVRVSTGLSAFMKTAHVNSNLSICILHVTF